MRISDWIRRVLFRSAHGCSLSRTPSTRTEFWEAKFARNRERDERLKRHASTLGWDTLTIWECAPRKIAGLTRRLNAFLGPPRSRLTPYEMATCSNDVASQCHTLSAKENPPDRGQST